MIYSETSCKDHSPEDQDTCMYINKIKGFTAEDLKFGCTGGSPEK